MKTLILMALMFCAVTASASLVPIEDTWTEYNVERKCFCAYTSMQMNQKADYVGAVITGCPKCPAPTVFIDGNEGGWLVVGVEIQPNVETRFWVREDL